MVGAYTEKCAARDTRRAIEGVRRAMQGLRLCARHWADLDGYFEAACDRLPDLPDDVQQLLDDINELHPKRGKALA